MAVKDVTISFPLALLREAPDNVRAWLLDAAGVYGKTPATNQEAATDSNQRPQDGYGSVRLSDAQVRRFLRGVSTDTRQLIEAIVNLGPRCTFAEILKTMGIKQASWSSLGGKWAGITKRTRTVTGDPEAELLVWKNWRPDDFASTIVAMDTETHKAFSRALAL